jgi:hypothetical protein
MSKMQGYIPPPMPKRAFYPMKIPPTSRFRLDLSLPLFTAATYSVFP